MYELNFGPVPVGQRITRFIELYNQGAPFCSRKHQSQCCETGLDTLWQASLMLHC